MKFRRTAAKSFTNFKWHSVLQKYARRNKAQHFICSFSRYHVCLLCDFCTETVESANAFSYYSILFSYTFEDACSSFKIQFNTKEITFIKKKKPMHVKILSQN